MSNQIEINKNLIKYLSSYSYRPDKIINELINETKNLGSVAKMQIAPEQGQFIELFVKAIKAKNCLEIGRFTGLSALFIAKGLPENGKVITIDNSDKFLNIAKNYWVKAGVNNKINSLIGDGIELLNKLIKKNFFFDLIFIDADKNNYNNYYELSLNLLKSNGFILIDNVLSGGRVVKNNSFDTNTKNIHALNKKIFKDKRVDFSLLPIADGLAMVRKK